MIKQPESYRPIVRKIATTLIPLVGFLGIASCSDQPVPLSTEKSCAAINPDGKIIEPTSYPLGEMRVGYNPKYLSDNDYFAKTDSIGNILVKGVIEQHGSDFALNVKGVPRPSRLENVFDNHTGQAAAFYIDSPQTGRIGFTESCVSQGPDQNNIPSTIVELPII